MFSVYVKHRAGPRRGKWTIHTVCVTRGEAFEVRATLMRKGERVKVRDSFSGTEVKPSTAPASGSGLRLGRWRIP